MFRGIVRGSRLANPCVGLTYDNERLTLAICAEKENVGDEDSYYLQGSNALDGTTNMSDVLVGTDESDKIVDEVVSACRQLMPDIVYDTYLIEDYFQNVNYVRYIDIH